MADTGDRRSEFSNDTSARRKYRQRKSDGVCGHCGVNPVQGRTWCFNCVDNQAFANFKLSLRRFFGKDRANRLLKNEGYGA